MIGGHPLSGILQGADYKVTRLAGWWNRPAVKRAEISRERADGDFPTPWNFEARRVGIDGWVMAKDHGQMHHIMDQLNGLCATNREWLTVQGHGMTQSALVEADDTPYLYPETDRMLRFELRFKANDPRKIGQLHTVDLGSEFVNMSQQGNYPALPTFDVRVANAPDGYRLIGRSGQDDWSFWEYRFPVVGVEEHHIDFSTGKHFLNNGERPWRLGRAEMFKVSPKVRSQARFLPIGAGVVSGQAHYHDTWI